MPNDMSDSEYALILAGRRRGLPLLANAGADTLTELRHGVPLQRIAAHIASGIKALHVQVAVQSVVDGGLRVAFRRMLFAYLGLYNMLGAAADATLVERLLTASRPDLERWLRLIALEGDVSGTAELVRTRRRHRP
jgi:hypothetical protein